MIRDTCFGGYVHTFKKTSSSPTQTSFTDSIAGLINSGVSMISFFGHSSANVFDFNLNPPSYYSNSNGKYPFFGAYGCSSGDIHQPVSFGPSANEEYVLSPKGMIGFLASSGPGTADDLNQFAKNFYFGVDHFYYGKPVGKSIQYSIDVIQPTGTTPDPYRSATCLEMTLHGDPAIVIHSNKLPDYAINPTSLYFKPTYISTDLDSFKANVVVTNIGKANHDSVRVKIIRKFSDGTSASYTKTVANLYFKDTLIFTLPVDPNHGTGLNKFEIHVLHTNSELSYLNNDISPPNEIPLMVYSGDIIPVYPYKYAIVPHDTLTLKAYTADPFSGAHRYKFEIDTTDRFNSGWKKTQYVTQAKGAVVKAPANFWSPSLSLVDSTVYFWRVRRDTSDLQNFKWRESSFQYISGRRGWGQSHFFQFLKGDRFGYLDTIRSSRSVDFQKQNHSLEVKTSNYCRGGSGLVTFYIDLNTNVYSGTNYNTCAFPYVIICVIDPITGLPWNSIGGAGGMGYEIATGTPGDQDSLRRFIENDIPAGSKVILFTPRNHNLGDLVGASASLPNPGLVHAFQSIGGGQFTNLRNNRPYILIGRKNGAGVEMIASADSSTIDLIDTFNLRRSSGTIFSETVGPASKWNSFHWKYRSLESSATSKDSVTISIAGINNSGIPVVLKTINTHDSLDLSLSSINASNYATLQLTAMLMDSIKRTPPQLKYWRVYYDGVPDAALNPVKHYSFYNPTVQQGDSIKMSVAIENIGDYNMDSLWVDFWVYDSNRNKVPVRSIKMDSLRINKILVPSIKFSTNNTPGGLNSLWVEANPFNSQHQQLEQYHFNNLGT
ncbi:MAG TPA: C25 family cysteine peptidase, partial [Bacteroidia bacterium]